VISSIEHNTLIPGPPGCWPSPSLVDIAHNHVALFRKHLWIVVEQTPELLGAALALFHRSIHTPQQLHPFSRSLKGGAGQPSNGAI